MLQAWLIYYALSESSIFFFKIMLNIMLIYAK